MSGVQEWQEISRETVFEKYGRGIEKRTYRLPQGKEADFYLSTGHESVACLALTSDQKVILVKQFRPGPAKILLEMPGGGLQSDENIQKAMERELREETGYIGDLQFVGTVLPSAYATYKKNFFVATQCNKIAEPKLEDNGEVVEPVLLFLDEFRDCLRAGQMTDVEGGYLCLDFLHLL